MELLTYLIKVTACTAAFYTVYYFLLHKLTFFSLNRWYLLSSLTLSLAIPLLHMGITMQAPVSDVKPVTITSVAQTIVEATTDPVILSQPTEYINWLQVVTYAYFA